MPICLQFNLTFITIFYLSLECLNETQTSESFTSAFSCPLENQTKENKFVCLFFGRIYSTPICLQFNLTFTTIFYLSFDCLNETQTQVKALRAPSPALLKTRTLLTTELWLDDFSPQIISASDFQEKRLQKVEAIQLNEHKINRYFLQNFQSTTMLIHAFC